MIQMQKAVILDYLYFFSTSFGNYDENTWSWVGPVFKFWMEHVRSLRYLLWTSCCTYHLHGTEFHICGSNSYYKIGTFIQNEEALSRYNWYSCTSHTSYVFNSCCYARSILFLCNHWNGII